MGTNLQAEGEMTDKEVDRLWGVALHESVTAGEMFTRYRFAALLAEAEREQCARMVEQYAGAWSDQGYALAQAIRGRK